MPKIPFLKLIFFFIDIFSIYTVFGQEIHSYKIYDLENLLRLFIV